MKTYEFRRGSPFPQILDFYRHYKVDHLGFQKSTFYHQRGTRRPKQMQGSRRAELGPDTP